MPTVFQRFVAAVNREFEQRAQRVSQPAEEPPATHAEEEWDEGEVAIANVPRGTMLASKPGEDGKSMPPVETGG